MDINGAIRGQTPKPGAGSESLQLQQPTGQLEQGCKLGCLYISHSNDTGCGEQSD